MRFPGTITVPEAAFEQVLESAARSFKLHGFRDIVLLGDHGGYQKSLHGRRRPAEPRMGAHARPRARDRRVLPRRGDRVRADAHAVAAIATTRSARTRGSPTRRSRWRSIRASCGPNACRQARSSAPPTASTAIRAGRPPSSGRLGVDAIVADDGRCDPAAPPCAARSPPDPESRPARALPIVNAIVQEPSCPSGNFRVSLRSRLLAWPGCRRARLGAGAGGTAQARRRSGRRHGSGHAAGRRPGQSLQRNDRRKDERGGRRRSAARLRAAPAVERRLRDRSRDAQGRRQVQGRPQPAARRAVVGPAHAVGRQQRGEHEARQPHAGRSERRASPARPITVDDPYNMYFSPDGKSAIVVAEALQAARLPRSADDGAAVIRSTCRAARASTTPISRSTAGTRSSPANSRAPWPRSTSSTARCWATRR